MWSILLPLTLISSSFATLQRRDAGNPDPTVAGSTEGGWQSFPDVAGGTAYDWVVDASIGAKLPVYQTSNLTAEKLTRAIITLPGNPRDCWYYFNTISNALLVANQSDATIRLDSISIMTPCFFDQQDLAAGAVKSDQLSWKSLDWIAGEYNENPPSVSKYSSYDAVDSLVAYYMNRNMFPNIKVVVVAGHSAGGQMAQRYLGLRSSTVDDERLHFWIANPASLMWLNETHPIATPEGCTGVDDYKYGLSGTLPGYATADWDKLGRDGFVARYGARKANYAWGLDDDTPGDTGCEAATQGTSHLSRGQYFVPMLEGLYGSLPENTTVDWIPGVGHDNVLMMQSPLGTEKLFVYESNVTYEGTSPPISSTIITPGASGTKTAAASSGTASSGSSSSSGSGSGSDDSNGASFVRATSFLSFAWLVVFLIV